MACISTTFFCLDLYLIIFIIVISDSRLDNGSLIPYRSRDEADHQPPSAANVKKAESYTCTPPLYLSTGMSSWHGA
jgi:hypothetical protein